MVAGWCACGHGARPSLGKVQAAGSAWALLWLHSFMIPTCFALQQVARVWPIPVSSMLSRGCTRQHFRKQFFSSPLLSAGHHRPCCTPQVLQQNPWAMEWPWPSSAALLLKSWSLKCISDKCWEESCGFEWKTPGYLFSPCYNPFGCVLFLSFTFFSPLFFFSFLLHTSSKTTYFSVYIYTCVCIHIYIYVRFVGDTTGRNYKE